MKILVLHSTHDGQTEGVAERIGFRLSRSGHTVTVRSADAADAAQAIAASDAIVVGGAIRYGRFAASLVDLVRANATEIARRPNAFYSVSLSAAKDVAPAFACMTEFQAATGWFADDTAAFAGALRYSHYSPFMRFMMKLIAHANGEKTDTSHDYEYTDWKAVDRFAAAFALRVVAPLPA